MALNIIFTGTEESRTEDNELVLYHNALNNIYINITDKLSECSICLDRETAIKLSKELKKQIALFDTNE